FRRDASHAHHHLTWRRHHRIGRLSDIRRVFLDVNVKVNWFAVVCAYSHEGMVARTGGSGLAKVQANFSREEWPGYILVLACRDSAARLSSLPLLGIFYQATVPLSWLPIRGCPKLSVNVMEWDLAHHDIDFGVRRGDEYLFHDCRFGM